VVAWPQPDETERARREGMAEATRLIESGRLSAAAQALRGDCVAPDHSQNDAVLNDKHPDGPDSPFAGTEPTVPYSPEAFPADLFDSAIASFRPDTAPGPSGWTVPLLRHVLRAPSGVPLQQHLTHHIACGTAPGRSMLCSSRLTPLPKDDGRDSTDCSRGFDLQSLFQGSAKTCPVARLPPPEPARSRI
jgi:hypothetical protein